MTDLVQRARALAIQAHGKQKDKNGAPYWHHLRDVAAMVKLLGGDEHAVAGAWLHDVVEDTKWTIVQLAEAGIPLETLVAVEAVTKKNFEPQTKYLARVIEGGRRAMLVKVADLFNNTRPDRMAQLNETTRNRLLKKYRPSLLALLLELELVATEDTQAKLATTPVGSMGSYGGTSGSWKGTNKYGPDETEQFEAHALIGGDWPLDWPAPIAEKLKKGQGANTYLLSDGNTRTAYGKTWAYVAEVWADRRRENPEWLPKRSSLKWSSK